MINILEAIGNIVRNDKEHTVKVEINEFGVKVFLEYDPDRNFKEEVIIPIEYNAVDEFAYIPDCNYRTMYNPDDYGIGIDEIRLIHNIMEYLETNKEEINKLCTKFGLDERED